MGLQALITIDLPNATSEQRELFYEVLAKAHWHKIKTLTTSWKAVFKDEITRARALNILKLDLTTAKTQSKVHQVEYAIQLDIEPIDIGNL